MSDLDTTAIADDPDHSADAVDLQLGDGAMNGFVESFAKTLSDHPPVVVDGDRRGDRLGVVVRGVAAMRACDPLRDSTSADSPHLGQKRTSARAECSDASTRAILRRPWWRWCGEREIPHDELTAHPGRRAASRFTNP